MCPAELFSVCKNNTLPPPFGVISGVFWNSALDGNTHVDTSSRTSDKTGSSRAEAISNVAPIAASSVPRFPDSPNVCSFCSPNRFPRFGRIIPRPRPRPRPRPLVHGLSHILTRLQNPPHVASSSRHTARRIYHHAHCPKKHDASVVRLPDTVGLSSGPTTWFCPASSSVNDTATARPHPVSRLPSMLLSHGDIRPAAQ